MKPSYKDVIDKLKILTLIVEFKPIVIGTPPLGISTDESDIDVACESPDFQRFSDVVSYAFGQMNAFSIRTVDNLSDPAVVASFSAMRWEVELFCQRVSTDDQWGVRHFRIEEKLLVLKPSLREAVVRLKLQGLKTEPAFAKVLSLPGDPYTALLELEGLDDDQLSDIVAGAKAR